MTTQLEARPMRLTVAPSLIERVADLYNGVGDERCSVEQWLDDLRIDVAPGPQDWPRPCMVISFDCWNGNRITRLIAYHGDVYRADPCDIYRRAADGGWIRSDEMVYEPGPTTGPWKGSAGSLAWRKPSGEELDG